MDLSNYRENKEKFLLRLIWVIVNHTIFRCLIGVQLRYVRNIILRGFGAKIPLDSLIYSSCKIWAPWNLEIGKYSCIGPNTELYNKGLIVIKEHSVVSQGAKLYTASHDINSENHSLIVKPIVLNNKTWIAADCFIGPGVTINEGAVVGARSAVFKNVEAWTVVGGNPAKYLKNRIITK